jgi:hypothetical protein
MAVKKAKAEGSEEKSNPDMNQKVQELAYENYLKRVSKNQPGDAVSDWSAAEAKLNGKKKS